ncbi:MAG TPA: NFACT RNA binding domain-containing protein [Balneolaceae bacterium]
MNNYYTLIYLIPEIKEKLQGGFYNFAISPHKDVLHIYVEKGGETYRLIFSANSSETALFHDFYRPPKKSNVIDFFTSLEGQKITDVKLADKDRLAYIYFENGQYLLFKLFSGHPNVFLVKGDEIIDAFKNPESVKGDAPPEPFTPAFKDAVSPKKSAKNQMLELNPLLPRNLLPHLIEQNKVDEMSTDEVKTFTRKITDELLENSYPRVLKSGDFCLWAEKWLPIESEKECRQVNDCVAFAYKNAVHLRRIHNKKEDVIRFLSRIENQKSSLVKQLKQADKSLERAEEYEKFGHLLMAHAHEKLPVGQKEVTLEDFYEGQQKITIPLKNNADIAGNAELYYKKAKDARKANEKAKQRLPVEKNELGQVQNLLTQIKKIEHLPDLNSWLKDKKETLEKFGFGSSDEKQVSSPYRKFKAGKYEIWIGKNAKSNDELTSLAHKEDVWLHARGVGGSHVVIRMGNQKDYPPKNVILRAAGFAAWYSKARGMEIAPVMYTKRKYVRKPKGAAPGAVLVEREEVELVPPVNPKMV